MLRDIVLRAIVAYRRSTSKSVVHASRQCIFYPTCSAYAFISIRRFGLIKGGILGAKRIYRCDPMKSKGGHDPVPSSLRENTNGIPI